MERLSEIIDQQPELKNDIDLNQIALPPITGNVSFRNVSFRFAGSGQYQLNDVSIDIPAGSFVGVVGQSGSGKKYFNEAPPRLYEPNKGSISIDNYDISKVELSSLRRQIGIVPQRFTSLLMALLQRILHLTILRLPPMQLSMLQN